jgi:hypothetical protein
MLKALSSGTHASRSGAVELALLPIAETLADLSRPIARHLHHRAPGWCWEVQSVQEVGGAVVVVTGRLTIPTADGELLNYSAVVSEPLESASDCAIAMERNPSNANYTT